MTQTQKTSQKGSGKKMPKLPSLPAKLPRGIIGGIKCSARADLPALPLPNRDRVHAYLDHQIVDRWERDFSGVCGLERGDNVITMFELIGEDFWSGGGITASSVAKQLRAIGGPVEVQINSPGGDVFEGFAIYNLLREHPYDVNVKVVGMAASAASVIAMAGDNVQIGAAAFIMIHNCWTFAIGNRHDLRETADFLEPFDQALADVYVARTGSAEADIKRWLDAETYMSGSQAIERGFADALLPSDQIGVDEEQGASAREANAVRAVEQTLVASGLTRTQARERIGKVKGTRDAAPKPDDAGKPDAAAWTRAAGGFRAAVQSITSDLGVKL